MSENTGGTAKQGETTDDEFFSLSSDSSSDRDDMQTPTDVGQTHLEEPLSQAVQPKPSNYTDAQSGEESSDSDTEPNEEPTLREGSVNSEESETVSSAGSTLMDADDEEEEDDDSNNSDVNEDENGYEDDDEEGQLNMVDYDSDFVQKESPGEYKVGGYHPVTVGDVFKDRYYAIHKLGWGHFSVVWMCFDTWMERYCAIKVVKSADHFTETARDEIELLHAISVTHWHPLRDRIVQLSDHFNVSGSHGTHLCLVFEILGDNLLKLIQRSRYHGLPIRNVKQIALQVLEGLYYIHVQCCIIHTDLKPENVLVVANDLGIRAQATRVVAAFFKANAHLIKPRNAAGGTNGTRRSASYLSPENCGGDLSGQAHSSTNANKSAGKRARKGTNKSSNKSTTNCSSKNGENVPPVTKLTKSAKRKLRARAKRSVSFFLDHRQWLRQQGIEDLLTLARHGYLTPAIAVQAFTGKMAFMPDYEDIEILNENDLVQLERYEQLERESEKKSVKVSVRKIWQSPQFKLQHPQPYTYIGKQLPKEEYSETVRLLVKDPLEFMWFVQKKVTDWDMAERERHQLDKVMPRTRKTKPQCTSVPKKKIAESGIPTMTKQRNWLPNMEILSRKDPANEYCPLKVKIADMGNACWFNHHFTDDIQTREYRAPEVILGAGYNEMADIWSAACLFWELATGDYLFNPQERRGRATLDETHIASIMETCGPIPKELINLGDFAPNFFKPNGKLRNITNLQHRCLGSVLVSKYGWSSGDARQFALFLKPMLNTDPRKRSTALNATMHTWLEDREERTSDGKARRERKEQCSGTTREGTPDPRASGIRN